MRKFAIKSLANMLGIYIASLLFPALLISSPVAVFWAGLALGVINLLIRPLLLLISLPINFVTLGLFTLVINAWLVMLATHLVSGVYIPSFLLAFATAFIIFISNIILEHVLKY
jgi:putative membrane protein